MQSLLGQVIQLRKLRLHLCYAVVCGKVYSTLTTRKRYFGAISVHENKFTTIILSLFNLIIPIKILTCLPKYFLIHPLSLDMNSYVWPVGKKWNFLAETKILFAINKKKHVRHDIIDFKISDNDSQWES